MSNVVLYEHALHSSNRPIHQIGQFIKTVDHRNCCSSKLLFVALSYPPEVERSPSLSSIDENLAFNDENVFGNCFPTTIQPDPSCGFG
jgi:hypothetical protein